MSGHRRFFFECNHHVAQQRQHAGKRFSQYWRQYLGIPRRAHIMLPQFQQDSAQVMLDLHAMQVHRHVNFRNDVCSVKHSPSVLHIQNFDGENIRGMPQFLFREKKRRGLFLLDAPPFHHRREAPQLLDTQRMQDANHIEIRVSFVKITTRSRPEQNDAFEVCRGEFLHPVDQFRQFCFRGEHFSAVPFLPPHQSPEAPPPPLLPPPNPPNPPPPPPPPKPPPPQPPFERLPVSLASIPSRNQSSPPPPDPPPRPRPERLPTARKRINRPRMTQNIGNPMPPPRFGFRTAGGWPLSVTPASSAMYFANCHAATSVALP